MTETTKNAIEKLILDSYIAGETSLRDVATACNTDHHRVKRVLEKYKIPIVKAKRKPFTQEHRENLSKAVMGKSSWAKGKKMPKESLYKNMATHLRFEVGWEWLSEYEDIEKLKFLNRSITNRDRRWEKIEHSYKVMTGQGCITELTPKEYLKSEYDKGVYDEFITPTLFNKDSAIKDDDCVFFVNFRPDRAIQMSLALNDPSFNEFEINVKPGYYLCMTPYIPDEVELPILFDKEVITGGISNILSDRGYKQLKIAETEKYAHVTFFFNGGRKTPFPGEEHILVPSDKSVKTYDEKPQMSAPEVTDKLLSALDDDNIKFCTVNYANSDMVGHTGNFEAAIKAIETLDDSVKKLMDKCAEKDITMLITADHGNSDQMTYPDGKPHTSHTNSPVPCCVFHKKLKSANIRVNKGNHSLKDVAATLMYIMGEKYGKNFTGKNIFR